MRIEKLIGKVCKGTIRVSVDTVVILFEGLKVTLSAGAGNECSTNGMALDTLVGTEITEALEISIGFHKAFVFCNKEGSVTLFNMLKGNPKNIGELSYREEKACRYTGVKDQWDSRNFAAGLVLFHRMAGSSGLWTQTEKLHRWSDDYEYKIGYFL